MIITIYSKLSSEKKNLLNDFLKSNFKNKTNFDLLENTIIILEILNNIIIGCICIIDNYYLKEELISKNISFNNYYFDDSHGCFIYNLCVHKDHRNKNIGNNLIKKTIEKMKEINIDYLHVYTENEISLKLFLKNNFIIELELDNDVKLLYTFL
jgi:ribosomal protein S18 acetylase RimI-like enzyme